MEALPYEDSAFDLATGFTSFFFANDMVAALGQAGLTSADSFDASWTYEYPYSETLGRALIAAAGLALLVGPEREEEAKAAIVESLARYYGVAVIPD